MSLFRKTSISEAAYEVRELVPAFPRATAVSAVPLLTTHLVRSLYPAPFRAHLSRATAVSAVLFPASHLARSLYAEPFRAHLSRATAVSAVPLLTTYLVRSLYPEPFREHLSRATAVSAVLFLTTYLARSLYPEPFREHLSRATAVSAVLFLTTYLARSLYPEPFREHLLVPLPSRQCSFLRRTLFVPFTLNHSANSRLPRRNRPTKPPWSAGTCSRFLVYSRPQTTQFARSRSPNSDLRSPTPCVLDVRSSAFRRFPQQSRPRQEPRKTRITRKAEQVGLAHAALRVSIPSVPKGRS